MANADLLRRTRRPTPALLFNSIVSAGLLTILSIEVRLHHVARIERGVFRIVNGLPQGTKPFFIAVMQLGSYGAILIAAFGAVLLRRRRLGAELLLAGNIAYWGAFVCKLLVARPRPSQLLTHVTLRETIRGSLGYPSGHVAVATALGITIARFIPRRFRRLVWLAIAVVGLARIYVGAHLPVDVIGGFLVGWLAVCLTQFVLGEAIPPRSLANVRAVLRARGIELAQLDRLSGDARGSTPLHGRTTGGQDLFIKVTGNEQRDADWLFKLYRRAIYRNIDDQAPFITAKQKSEHEAYVSLLVERGGIRTPHLITTATDAGGNAFLVHEFIEGQTLDRLTPEAFGGEALTDIWRQVALLHRAGIAHRDLRAANILMHDSAAHVIDLGFAEVDASADQQARDVVELLTTTAHLSSPEASVSAARSQVGCDALVRGLPYLQKAALSHAARAALRRRPDLLDNLRSQIMQQCGAGPVAPAPLVRVTRRSIFLLIMLGLAVHFLLPQIGEVRTAVRDIVRASPWWLLCSFLASAATYVFSMFAFRAAVQGNLPLRPTALLQIANSFANRLAPSSVGGAALSTRFLQKQGLTTPAAVTAVAIIRLAAVVSTVALLPVLLLFARNTHVHVVSLSKGLTILLAVLGAVLVIAGVVALPRLRKWARSIIGEVVGNIRSFLTSGRPWRLIGLSVLVTLAYGACLYFALLAVGVSPSIPHVLLVSIAGSSVASAAPTPGGLGATEAAMVSGLVIFATPIEAAIAGVLIYRIMSFWLPIAPGAVALRLLARSGAV